MNALELAGRLDTYARGDEYQRVPEEAAAMLRSQHAEVEVLKQEGKSLRLEIMAYSHYVERVKGEQAAEIEILKQERAQRTMFKKTDDAAFVKQVKETTELRTENRELREALTLIASTAWVDAALDPQHTGRIARAALVDTRIKVKET